MTFAAWIRVLKLIEYEWAQLLTYLRTGSKPMGLMINFNADPIDIIEMVNEPDKHTAARTRPRWR